MATKKHITYAGKSADNDTFRNERESAKVSIKKRLALNKILGKSLAVQNLHSKIVQVADCNVNVLISGESGTGKELVARAIHYVSQRAGKPFVPINCGAIPENLFENELFGHAKGAFTDAGFAQRGLVSEAEGGTLFLDEIGTVAPYSQVKLLRLLQDNEYKPLGDSRSRLADIRIIAATNKDLLDCVRNDTFRGDLFYRLNIVSINVPPLRERKEDIPVLVDYFLNRYIREYDKSPKSLTRDAMNILCSYSWPGNIRELENKMQQMIVMSPAGTIRAEDVMLPVSESSHLEREKNFNKARKKAVESFEKNYFVNLLSKSGGNVAAAARSAEMNRTALWNRLKKLNISPKQFS